ncbi:hypothetical protein CTY70_07920, partial [Acinetobacter baumannii]|nr:hypothetical protein [Acinetobacter baumannii]
MNQDLYVQPYKQAKFSKYIDLFTNFSKIVTIIIIVLAMSDAYIFKMGYGIKLFTEPAYVLSFLSFAIIILGLTVFNGADYRSKISSEKTYKLIGELSV